jgi:RNA polymerase sigma-70 factor (ECF subfamily)
VKMVVLAPPMNIPPADSHIERVFGSRAENRTQDSSGLQAEVTSLFDDLRAPLLRYLSSFGLALHDSEEVIQEVFLSLFLHLRAGKPRTNIRGWLFRVAHNLGLKRREANHRVHRIVAGEAEDAMESHLDQGPDPEAQVSFIQRRERLLAVVDALPDTDRQCLYLRAEGLQYRDIAEILGISLGGVALSLARSLARLGRADGG